MESTYDLSIDQYIDSDAFCPVNAPKEVREAFLGAIGINITKKSVTFNANLLARHILEYTTLVLLNNDDLAIYDGKRFEINEAYAILRRIIHTLLNCVCWRWKLTYEKETIESIKRSLMTRVINMDTKNVINLRNGTLDLDTLTLHQHSPEFLCSTMVDTDYDPNAKCPQWLKFLNQIFQHDEDRVAVLQEIFGAAISNARTQKAAVFYGAGMNGKSVVGTVLKHLCGGDNVGHVPLGTFEDEFGLQPLLGKKLNIATELETGDLKISTGNFKSIVSGDPVQVNIKFHPPLNTVLNCKLVFLTNNLPQTNDASRGYFRRLLIVPFDYTVSEDEKDVFLTEKLCAEACGILNWAITGYHRLVQNNYRFTKCDAVDKMLQSYQSTINPVSEFFDSSFTKQANAKIRRALVYDHYEAYCKRNGYTPLERQRFWKYLNAHLASKQEEPRVTKAKGIEYFRDYVYIPPAQDLFEKSLLDDDLDAAS